MFKKLITTLLLVSIITPFFYLPHQAKKAEAVLGFGDIVIDIKALADRIVDGFAMVIAQQMVDRMVQSTVKWAQSGFEGGPAYATDPKQYFSNLADGVAGDFIRGTDLGFLCSPFQASIRVSLTQNYYESQPFQCTLTQITGNIEDFYNDFSKGGWDAWFTMTQNPVNNPYGAFLAAKVELDSRVASALNVEQKQLDWNQGFLSWSKCLRTNESAEYIDEWNPETEEFEHIPNPNHQGGKAEGECLARGPTETPGSTIKAQLDKVLPSGLDKLITAQHIDQLVSAFAAGLLQKYVFGPKGIFSKNNSPDATASGANPDIDGDHIPDGLDNNGDGQLDICYFGGTTTRLGPPCLGSREASEGRANEFIDGNDTGGGEQCTLTGNVYESALRNAMNAVLAANPDVANLENRESNDRQNARAFLTLVRNELISQGYSARVDVLNGNGNPSTGDLIAVWRSGDATMERYDAIQGELSPVKLIKDSTQTDFTGSIPLNCTSTGGGTNCGCGNDGGGVDLPSLLSDLQAERAKYGASITPAEAGKILNAVAWNNRAGGWVLLGKASGSNCPAPNGTLISCDFLVHKPSLSGFDVFVDVEGKATPTWNGPESISAAISNGSRTLVDPTQP